LAEWKFEVVLTNRAKADYQQLQTVAERSIPDLRPLPSNADSRFRNEVAVVEHYDRTRRILSSLKDPRTAQLDVRMMGRLSSWSYRTEHGTSVYFRRTAQPPTVTVAYISDAPLDYDALLKLVFSGNAHVIPAVIGVHMPPSHLAGPLSVN
jgi:hypothetical protein